MSRTARVLHTARTITTGGREDGTSRSSDGLLDVRLSTPGSARIGTSPEQLLAAGWSASLASAIASVARQRGIPLPAPVKIEAELDLNLGQDGCSLSARLDIRLTGVAQTVAESLIVEARALCPYTKAMRSSVQISVNLA